MSLVQLAIAAARETFATATPHFVAAWTDLFQSMMATSSTDLRWRESGPGIGRDARIAYSGLLGRYLARAYLTWNEGVRVLVPLDTAKGIFRNTSYRLIKQPSGHGLEADWIGLDARQRLVIVEAKGTFNARIRAWKDTNSLPAVLRTAIGQAQRSVVTKGPAQTRLPSKRWAIASRWANEHNKLDPTLIAWNETDQTLDYTDYLELSALLHRTDVMTVMTALGHLESVQSLNMIEPEERMPGEISLVVGDHAIQPGFAALLGPLGILPLHDRDDLEFVHRLRELTPGIAFASLSSRYASTIVHRPLELEESALARTSEDAGDADTRFAHQAGLTVAWPTPDDRIALADD